MLYVLPNFCLFLWFWFSFLTLCYFSVVKLYCDFVRIYKYRTGKKLILIIMPFSISVGKSDIWHISKVRRKYSCAFLLSEKINDGCTQAILTLVLVWDQHDIYYDILSGLFYWLILTTCNQKIKLNHFLREWLWKPCRTHMCWWLYSWPWQMSVNQEITFKCAGTWINTNPVFLPKFWVFSRVT